MEARRSVRALRPESLEHSSLTDVLRRHCEQMTAGTPVRVAFEVHGAPYTLPPQIETDLLRIGLEALTNAIKHAQASMIRIKLNFDAEQVRLSVRDNGQGFDPQQRATAGGFGLAGMRERVDSLGGQLTIHSRPGKGTKVIIAVPVAQADRIRSLA